MNAHEFARYYDITPYVPGGHDFFGDAIVVQPHPDGEGQLWHITTPLGALSPRALALIHPMTLEEREAQVLAAYPSLRGDPHHDSRARR